MYQNACWRHDWDTVFCNQPLPAFQSTPTYTPSSAYLYANWCLFAMQVSTFFMRHETHCKLASYIYQKKYSSFADGPAWCVGKHMDRRKTRHGKLSGQNIVRDFCIAASYMAMGGWTSCEMTRRSWKWDRLPYFPPPSVFKQAAASRMPLDVFAEETCGREKHYASDFLAVQICRTKTVCYDR